jgi:hypothetical protein
MQKDFHFYTIYVLCRGAGIKPDLARTIAYASQYVDDAKFGEAISFANGGRFQQEMTAHELIAADTLKPETQYRIFSAFHFLPGNAQNLPRVSSPEPKFRERTICTPGSSVSQELLEHVKRIANRSFSRKPSESLFMFTRTPLPTRISRDCAWISQAMG